MLVKFGGIALICLIGLPIGQAVAQDVDGYPPRVVATPYPDDLPPGYYRRVPRRYLRRLPNGEVVVVERRRRVYTWGVDPRPRFVRRYYRVVPGPYDDYDRPPRYIRERYASPADPDIGPVPSAGRRWRYQPNVPDDRSLASGDRRMPERHAALPQADEPYSDALPAGVPGSSPRYASLPPDADQAVSSAELPRRLQRQVVDHRSREPAGTIIVDTRNTYLYYVLGDGRAIRYGIGVGREGFIWSGREKISRMAEWPDWYPPKEMIERQPYLPRMMAGGPGNPLGARALYLGNTLYRIHGTSDPSSIGKYVSSGCIRLLNQDVEDLYSRVHVGTRVVVLSGGRRPVEASARR